MDRFYICLAIVFVLALFSVPIYFVVQEHEKIENVRSARLFNHGDTVRMKQFGHEGTVVGVMCGPVCCTYNVRFSAIQSSAQHHILGSGGPIDVAPMTVIRDIREYELEKIGSL